MLQIAAIGGQLGQHQVVDPNGQPILDDPRFLVYENVSRMEKNRLPRIC